MTLKELHEKYGKATIQLKIITGQVHQLEQLIAEEMKKEQSNGSVPVLEKTPTESETEEEGKK